MRSSGAIAPDAAASRAAVSPGSAKAAASSNSARAQASRINGAKSRGPKTADGKARASRNALKHGLCARKHLLLPDDSRARFEALESALMGDLAPEGALQTLLAHRLIAAAWRLQRADRLEFELFCAHDSFERGLGRALVKDGRDAKVFPTLVRYRGAAQTEFFRTLKALKALQAEAAKASPAREAEMEKTPKLTVVPRGMPEVSAPDPDPCTSLPCATQDEPERRMPARKGDTEATRNEPERGASDHQGDTDATPNEPEIEESPSGSPARGRRAAGSDEVDGLAAGERPLLPASAELMSWPWQTGSEPLDASSTRPTAAGRRWR
jgi:hypothetical protein